VECPPRETEQWREGGVGDVERGRERAEFIRILIVEGIFLGGGERREGKERRKNEVLWVGKDEGGG